MVVMNLNDPLLLLLLLLLLFFLFLILLLLLLLSPLLLLRMALALLLLLLLLLLPPLLPLPLPRLLRLLRLPLMLSQSVESTKWRAGASGFMFYPATSLVSRCCRLRPRRTVCVVGGGFWVGLSPLYNVFKSSLQLRRFGWLNQRVPTIRPFLGQQNIAQ